LFLSIFLKNLTGQGKYLILTEEWCNQENCFFQELSSNIMPYTFEWNK